MLGGSLWAAGYFPLLNGPTDPTLNSYSPRHSAQVSESPYPFVISLDASEVLFIKIRPSSANGL